MSPTTVPEFLTRPLPVDAVADPALHAKIDELGARLPEGLPELHQALVGVRMFREYDAAGPILLNKPPGFHRLVGRASD